ncbi:phage tail component protein [Dictyocaulus viviparus]|uniref:Phage tail component protein n=1 Tax=Dictyocaulus viviparus TaxID=29172 RepID=A0A0D8XMI2_DICVI|nr:phage tail component protein [Dictyocaulus viviparus]
MCTTNVRTVLSVHLIASVVYIQRGYTVKILGTRVGKRPAELPSDSEAFFTVFGNNLPVNDYFLSTTDRCEAFFKDSFFKDFDSPDIVEKKIMPLTTDRVFKEAVRLHASDGVSFSEKFSTYHICNKNAGSYNKLLLQVTAQKYEGLWTPRMSLVICIVTIVISAYCSGISFAFMRMSINDMLLITENGDEPHKSYAKKIVKYRKQSNWLICTMAVMNCLVNCFFTTTISSILEQHNYNYLVRIAVSTLIIVLLAEILPQSVGNRYGLMLAAKTRHITLLLFIICAPIAYPLSRLIDYVLGREVREIYSVEKLKTLIKMQSKKMEEKAQGDILARIVDFPKKTVQDMMTPMEDAFVFLVTMLEKGYTRIPVFEDKNRYNLHTVLNVKDLATMTIDQKSTVQDFIDKLDTSKTELLLCEVLAVSIILYKLEY